MVSVLALFSDDPSSNPADAYSFFCKICVEKNKKRLRLAQFLIFHFVIIWDRTDETVKTFTHFQLYLSSDKS